MLIEIQRCIWACCVTDKLQQSWHLE